MSEAVSTPAVQVESTPAPTPLTAAATANAHEDKTFGQADVDRIVADRLAREKAKTAAEAAELAELKRKAKAHDEAEAARLTEAERLTKERDEANAALAAVRTEQLRRDVADELKVPANLRTYVQGDDEAAMRASAEKVLADFVAANPQSVAPQQVAPPSTHGPRPVEQLQSGAAPTPVAQVAQTSYPPSWGRKRPQ